MGIYSYFENRFFISKMVCLTLRCACDNFVFCFLFFAQYHHYHYYVFLFFRCHCRQQKLCHYTAQSPCTILLSKDVKRQDCTLFGAEDLPSKCSTATATLFLPSVTTTSIQVSFCLMLLLLLVLLTSPRPETTYPFLTPLLNVLLLCFPVLKVCLLLLSMCPMSNNLVFQLNIQLCLHVTSRHLIAGMGQRCSGASQDLTSCWDMVCLA